MSGAVRIGLITENHFPRLGGMEWQNHCLAAAFAELPQTHVAVACAAMPEVPRDFDYPYPVYHHRSFSVLTPWLASRSATTMIERERVNILHGAMLHGGGFHAVRLGRRLGLPVAVQAHGADLQSVPAIGYGALLDDTLAARVRFTLNHADLISVPCERMRRSAIENGAAEAKVHIVPPGGPTEAIARIPFEDMRARHGIAADEFLIVTVGRNRPIKRLGLLLEALGMLAAQGRRIRVVCIGPIEDLAGFVRKHRLENIVVLTGAITTGAGGPLAATAPPGDLINYYRAADVYVSTSHCEAFGLSALEALACGTPAIVTDGQGIQDFVTQGANGIVVQNPTASEVAAAIEESIDGKSGLARNEIAASVADLTWRHTAERLARLYGDIVRR